MKNISMKLHQVLAASAVLLAAAGLHAQTSTTTTTTQPDGAQSTTMQSSTVPTSTQTSMTGQGTDMNYPHLEADIEAAYAFRLRTTGIIADIGGNVAPGQFLGFEYSHFQPKGSTTDARAGTINSKEYINTYEFAYRFRMPLSQFAMNGQVSPVDFYAGLSGGIGSVRLNTTVPAFGFQSRSQDDGVLSGSGVAGLEWNITRNWGLKTGYRYIYMHHVNLFGTRGNIDSSVLEAGLNFRW
jgi:opacity protein-like surface antigen